MTQEKEYLNFEDISSAIPFKKVLDWLNIGYKQEKGELKGDGFIVSVEKNLFFAPGNDTLKGSVINFVAHHNSIELREAASLLKRQFLSGKKETKSKRKIPELTLDWDQYIEKRGIKGEIAGEYEVGYVKGRSIMSGRIGFKIYDHAGVHIGYIGYKKEDATWLFPKGFTRPLYNAHRLKDRKAVVVTTDPFDALRIVAMGYTQVVSLLGSSMTAPQEEQLSTFKYVLLLHKEPANIINRLSATCFIKAPVLSKPLQELSDDEVQKLIKPS